MGSLRGAELPQPRRGVCVRLHVYARGGVCVCVLSLSLSLSIAPLYLSLAFLLSLSLSLPCDMQVVSASVMRGVTLSLQAASPGSRRELTESGERVQRVAWHGMRPQMWLCDACPGADVACILCLCLHTYA